MIPGGIPTFFLNKSGGTPTDTGWVDVGTGANDASFGALAWSNPTNAQVEDATYAVAATGAVAKNTNYLKGTNLGLSVPSGATIDGIEVRFKAKVLGTASTLRVSIVKGGTVGTTDRTDSAAWTGTDTFYPYGSASDLWGDTWTPTDVNASTFGFVLAASVAGTSSARVDVMQVKVHYTP